jgi:hypothetical protein
MADGSGSPATQRNGNGSSPSAPISPSRPSKCENASPAKTNDVQELSQDHDGLIERAGALEAEAKALRDDARSVNREIVETVRELVAPGNPFTETYDFECEDEAIVAELAALSDNERADRLLSARGAAHGPIRETERGYWGDMNLASQPDFVPAPGGAWTGVGSPEWLDELFPGLRQGKANDDDQQRRHGRPAHCASTGSRQAGVPAGDARRWSH